MIGLLNAYRHQADAPQYQLDYAPMCVEFLERTFPGKTIRVFNVALGEFPNAVDECQAWVITGSPKAAYDTDPWIARLGQFIRDVDTAQQKLIGICFGHQLIAHSLGGKTEAAKGGWGVGVRTFQILKKKPWMQPDLNQVALLFSHQDQVMKLPPHAELLAEDDFCPHQMFSIGDHILSLQGHPEFTPQFAKGRLDSRIDRVGKEKYNRAVESLTNKTNTNEIGEWLRRFIG